MAAWNLSDLIADANEDLGIEFKAWMDTRVPENRANLARHIAALANHGGGYLVFGIDDTTRMPLGETEFERTLFGQDCISGIIKKYLDPKIQILIQAAEIDDVIYPVIVVPSHSSRPVIAISDGPKNLRGKTVGISQGAVYIRAAGPESIQIRNADDWNSLLERCLSYRADLLGSIFRQSITRQTRPDRHVVELLTAAVEDAAMDFVEQTERLAGTVASKYRDEILIASANYSAMGYALLDSEGEPIALDKLRSLNERVSVAMRRYAYYGWSSFLPLTAPEGAPTVRMSALKGEEFTYLEGRRVDRTSIIGSSYDYWRIYECGIAVSVESFRDNWSREGESNPPRLSPLWIFVALHSLLAHARLTGQEVPGTARVVVRLDWKGIRGRMLMWDSRHVVGPRKLEDDRFAKTITLSWAELRDDYFSALRRLAMPILDLFADSGWFDVETLLTPEIVRREFQRLNMDSMALFD